ncbi:MAG: GNAT family N-acetyltransferase [Kineosporiaceae bacterium]
MIVREARIQDAEDIARVQVDTWRVAYRGIMPDSHLAALDLAARVEMWRSVVDRPDAIAPRVAVVDDRVVGFVAAGPAGEAGGERAAEGQIFAIYVDAAWWGRGVGAVLLEAARTALRAAGFREARLWVLADNVRARAFYGRHGWVPDGVEQHEDFGGVVLTEVRYRCEL